MSKSSVLIFNGGSVGEGGSCNVHNLQLGVMTVNLPDFHTSRMYVLLDRSLPIDSDPGYAPVDRYTLAKWIHRGDVIQVDCANLTSETDTSYSGIFQSTTAVNQQGHVYTNTCTIRLDTTSNNHTESRYYRLEAVHDTLTDIWYLGQDINEVTTILNENASNKVQNLDNNSEHYPSCPAVKEAIETAVASVYHAAGPKTVAQLTSALLVAANQGNVYNITDSGITTADFVEGAGHPIAAGDNVGICDVGGGVYKFDLLSGFVDLSGYLAANGDGSDVTASFTATSTRTNVTTGEKLSVLFGKIAKWLGDLKALAFKDKVNTADIENDAVTADKMKDNETLPVNVTGTAATAVQLPIAYGGFDNQVGYRLLATVSAASAWNDRICSFDVFETGAGKTDPPGQIGVLTVQIRNNNGSYSYGAYYRGVDSDTFSINVKSNTDHSISVYVYSSGGKYGGLRLVLSSSSGYTGSPTGLYGITLYSSSSIQATITGSIVGIYKTVTPAGNGWIPLANGSGVGSATQPVYVDNNGVVQPCMVNTGITTDRVSTLFTHTLTNGEVSNGYFEFTIDSSTEFMSSLGFDEIKNAVLYNEVILLQTSAELSHDAVCFDVSHTDYYGDSSSSSFYVRYPLIMGKNTANSSAKGLLNVPVENPSNITLDSILIRVYLPQGIFTDNTSIVVKYIAITVG